MITQSTAKAKLMILAMILAADFSHAVVASEKKLMDDARVAYASAKFEKALTLYSQIPQTSDYWPEALEERAWAHLQLGENDKALSLVTTLTSDLIAPLIGPEPYFLRAMIDYRLCNIKGIFSDFELFRKRFKSRDEEMKKLEEGNGNISSQKAFAVLKSKKAALKQLTADDFGAEIQNLPRYFYRDPTILAAVEADSERRFLLRLGQLAESDSKETEMILQKMHLLESQVVQQVFAYNKQMHKKRNAEFSEKDKNALVFPYKSQNDIWLDEIDSFEAATTECPVDPFKGASL